MPSPLQESMETSAATESLCYQHTAGPMSVQQFWAFFATEPWETFSVRLSPDSMSFPVWLRPAETFSVLFGTQLCRQVFRIIYGWSNKRSSALTLYHKHMQRLNLLIVLNLSVQPSTSTMSTHGSSHRPPLRDRLLVHNRSRSTCSLSASCL